VLITSPKLGTRVLPEENWNWFDPDVVARKSHVGLKPGLDCITRAFATGAELL
jgi:hypothetical protein